MLDAITSPLITHIPTLEKPTLQDITEELANIKQHLTTQHATAAVPLIALLNELTEFELGRFLIKNQGALSGYWTDYIIQGHLNHLPLHPLEAKILNFFPAVLAMRQRYAIFEKWLQDNIKPNDVICSVPCGLMTDLLSLQLKPAIKNIKFVGIDQDASVLVMAKEIAEQTNYSYQLLQKDAWQLAQKNNYDIVCSNGLNFYCADEQKVIELYKQFYDALKPTGRLLISALTVPPAQTKHSEWDMSKVNKEYLQQQITLFSVILQARWANFRTTEETIEQLKAAGFIQVEVTWDEQRMFPVFVATKKN